MTALVAAAEPTAAEPRSARLLEQKARLQSLRDQAHERYTSGAPALQVGTLICDSVERLVIEIFEESLAALSPDVRRQIGERSAIVAVGGTGRGELAPYSDADFLFVHERSCPAALADCISRTVRDCWDAGIKLSHSVRTPGDALAAARSDVQFATALVEARRVWGHERLVERLLARYYRRAIRNRFGRFYHDCVAARTAERMQHGITDRQLEPDVKRSAGALRDIHLIRWIGYAAFGTPDLDLLRRQDALSREDADALREAHEFLTRVRVDLHYAAGKSQEILTREEQLRLAGLFGFAGTTGLRPVEQFMQTYFRHATSVTAIAERFLAQHRPRPLWARIRRFLLSHRSNNVFRVGGDEIDVPPRHLASVCGSLERLLGVYELAALYGARLSPELTEQIRRSVPGLPRDITPAAAASFLSLMGASGRMEGLLRGLFSTGLLEVLVPEMSHARCLLQFNQYHAYTVDEHSLRAVEAAGRFGNEPGPIGTAYRTIRHKDILHLALLLHDLGKGFDRDHSDVGREIAGAVADRLHLSSQQTEVLMFLVHKHLLMAHLALRRDLSDPELVIRFSREVGSPETLRMLYVLTAADISAVGPGAWTGWKAELLTELFERSMQILSGEPPKFRQAAHLERVRGQVHEILNGRAVKAGATGLLSGDRRAAGVPGQNGSPAPELPAGLERQLAALPLHYLSTIAPAQIAADLQDIAIILQGAAPRIIRGEFDSASSTAEYRVITRDQVDSGLFSKITGALAAKGLEILSANICTTADGIVIDRFRVVDRDYEGPIPEARLREIEQAVGAVLSSEQSVEELFQRHRRFLFRSETMQLFREPSRVVIDSDSSESFTVIEVFANDRRGLLYAIARALFDMNLSVSLAKIATHLDQALDVFYVTDRAGGKLQDQQRIGEIRSTLLARLEEFERRGAL